MSRKRRLLNFNSQFDFNLSSDSDSDVVDSQQLTQELLNVARHDAIRSQPYPVVDAPPQVRMTHVIYKVIIYIP